MASFISTSQLGKLPGRQPAKRRKGSFYPRSACSKRLLVAPSPKVVSFVSNSQIGKPASQPAKRRTCSFYPLFASLGLTTMYVCTNVCMYVCMYVCTYVCTYVSLSPTHRGQFCQQVTYGQAALFGGPNPEKRPPKGSWSSQAKNWPVLSAIHI